MEIKKERQLDDVDDDILKCSFKLFKLGRCTIFCLDPTASCTPSR